MEPTPRFQSHYIYYHTPTLNLNNYHFLASHKAIKTYSPRSWHTMADTPNRLSKKRPLSSSEDSAAKRSVSESNIHTTPMSSRMAELQTPTENDKQTQVLNTEISAINPQDNYVPDSQTSTSSPPGASTQALTEVLIHESNKIAAAI